MKSNPDKCHLLISTNNTVKMKIEHFDIANSRNEKLLGVKFDSKLTFDLMITYQNYVKKLVGKYMHYQE